jgi:hypothetical protein
VPIDDEVLIDAVRNLTGAKMPACANYLRIELQRIAQEDFESDVIADALARLASSGRLRRRPPSEWAFEHPESWVWIESGEPPPSYLVPYEVAEEDS